MADGGTERRATGHRVRPWLQLVRLPAVFTALTDVAAGFAIRRGGFEPVAEFVPLLTASAGLYLSGMVLNDLFDRGRDAEERPNRPIPSGRVSTRAASILGAALMVAGIASAASVSMQALWVALGLAACVLAYDGLLKATPFGPIAMGGCRFLNVMLGAAADDLPSLVWDRPQLLVALAIGVYVAGVTWFARTEEKASRRAALLGGAAVANVGLAILAAAYAGRPEFFEVEWRFGPNTTALALAVLAVAFTVDRRIAAAVADPSPQRVQLTVKLMLLSIITLDATVVLAATGNVVLALATAILLLPAIVLGRWVYMT